MGINSALADGTPLRTLRLCVPETTCVGGVDRRPRDRNS